MSLLFFARFGDETVLETRQHVRQPGGFFRLAQQVPVLIGPTSSTRTSDVARDDLTTGGHRVRSHQQLTARQHEDREYPIFCV